MDVVTNLRPVFADLWETREFVVPGGPRTHAYLWKPAAAAPVLFYSVGDDRDLDALGALGGVSRQYLSHQDEAGPMLRVIAERFGGRLHAPAAERAEIEAFAPVDVPLADRHVDDLGVEVVPTPGHSPGSTCYLVTGRDGMRYLFTGDTLLRDGDGVWRAGYVPGYSDRDGLRAALATLAELEADVVVSSAFYPGAAGVHRVDRSRWRDDLAAAASNVT